MNEYRRQCQVEGCTNPVKGASRFCSPKCRTVDWNARHAARAAVARIKNCPHCGERLRKPRAKKQQEEQPV